MLAILMNVTGADVTYYLALISGIVAVWRMIMWGARQEVGLSTFFNDVRDFMKATQDALQAQQQSLSVQDAYLREITKILRTEAQK